MIKAITIVRPASTPGAYEKLASFFSALGFEHGKGWNEPESRGASFLAPLGNLEFADGNAPALAEILVEVTALDSIEAVARQWMNGAWGEQEAARRIGAVAETDWKSRAFTIEPVPGHVFAFWEWLDPLKGKPLAIEGDLSAQGMRFAVVAARWNAVITDRLLQGALDALLRSGAAREDVSVIRVPGAWEIPAAARQAAESGQRRCRHHSRRAPARGDRPLRGHLQRGVPRHRTVAAGDGHSPYLWRADMRDLGAGARPRRDQGREQRL